MMPTDQFAHMILLQRLCKCLHTVVNVLNNLFSVPLALSSNLRWQVIYLHCYKDLGCKESV